MFFSRNFANLLDQVSIDVYRRHIDTRQNILLLSIQAWCDQLNSPKEVYHYIINGLEKQNLDSIYNAFLGEWGVSSTVFRFQKNPDITNFIKDVEEVTSPKNFKVKFYLLAAFLISAVGYALFIIESHKQEANQSIQKSVGFAQTEKPDYVHQADDKSFLILVINAKYEDIANTLRGKGVVTPNLVEDLYQATQELWTGTEQSFVNSPIKLFFEGETDELATSPSEYDVYFVKIELTQKDSGFGKNVNQLSRLDGFMKLPKIAKEIEVSNRLSSRSYENVGVYSR